MVEKLIVYNYDPITFEYTSSEPAGRNPLNPDEPIIPGCSTVVEPLEFKDGFAIVWIGNKWKYKEDHRGETWFNIKNMQPEVIDFIGPLDAVLYATLDSPIANKPEGNYWLFDSDINEWIGNALLYKNYVLNNFETYWEVKLNTPFEFKGFRYIPSWRDLYTSIWVSLYSGAKKDYRLQDYDGKFNTVNLQSMNDIINKLSNIVDELYTDKHDLEVYFKSENDFTKLENAFTQWVNKEYK